MPRLPSEIRITNRVSIPSAQVDLSYARSGGPGGQHVNKTSSKVLLRWNLVSSRALTDEDRVWLEQRLATKLTEEGDLLVTSERYRDQGRNVDDAVAKFAELLRNALARPKKRRKTKPTKASQRKRVNEKRRRGALKKERRRRDDD